MWPKSNVVKPFQRCSVFECDEKVYVVGFNVKSTEYAILEIVKAHNQKVDSVTILGGEKKFRKDDIAIEIQKLNSLDGFRKISDGFGVAGFIRLILGWYLILIVTRKRICRFLDGRSIYALDKTALVPLYTQQHINSGIKTDGGISDVTFKGLSYWFHDLVEKTVLTSTSPQITSIQKDENRLKELLGFLTVNRQFYLSYNHHLALSLQWNRVLEAAHRSKQPLPKLGNYIIGGEAFEWPFMWNYLHSKPFRLNRNLHHWLIPLIHGHVGHSGKFIRLHSAGRVIAIDIFSELVVCASGQKVEITLIARRSRFFAGTRYRKRGVNECGHVANDVEIEQIVFSSGSSRQAMSSVQNRSSVPLFWTQEANAIVPKPPILYTKSDPTLAASRRHFEDLFARYGSPLLVINLMKSNKIQANESELGAHFGWIVENLNKELPLPIRIRFIAWDIKAAHKIGTTRVSEYLCKLADEAAETVGYFHEISPIERPLRIQTGTLRTNCVDCLDRTNVAQYFIGRGLLEHQMKNLGLLPSPHLSNDSYVAKVLSNMYDLLGDQLALQYGGSVTHKKLWQHYPQLLHNPKEFLTSIQRHATNVFADFERQIAINLFLGIMDLTVGPKPWITENDSWLHLRKMRHDFKLRNWWTQSNAFFWESHQLLLNMSLCQRVPLGTIKTDYDHNHTVIQFVTKNDSLIDNDGIHNFNNIVMRYSKTVQTLSDSVVRDLILQLQDAFTHTCRLRQECCSQCLLYLCQKELHRRQKDRLANYRNLYFMNEIDATTPDPHIRKYNSLDTLRGIDVALTVNNGSFNQDDQILQSCCTIERFESQIINQHLKYQLKHFTQPFNYRYQINWRRDSKVANVIREKHHPIVVPAESLSSQDRHKLTNELSPFLTPKTNFGLNHLHPIMRQSMKRQDILIIKNDPVWILPKKEFNNIGMK